MKKKLKHGHYVLSHKKLLFIFNTYAKRGRIIKENGDAIDITFKSHPKSVRAILKKGKRGVSPSSFREERRAIGRKR